MGKVRTGARRPRKAALRFFLTLFKAILIAVFVVYALYYFSQSSFFALQKIEVRGQQHLTPGEVTGQSGLSDGVNIFQVNLDQARERLLTDPGHHRTGQAGQRQPGPAGGPGCPGPERGRFFF